MKNEDIIAEIAKYVEDHGIRRGWLAEKIGMPFSSLSLMLSNKRGLSVVEYVNICEALGESLDYFVDKAKEALTA